MARICETRRMSATSACLMMVVLVVVINLVVATEGGIYRPEFQSSQEEGHEAVRESQPSALLGSAMTRDDVKRELMRQLLILQEAEENIVSRMRQLEAERRALSNRKRSHYSSMCMFNVVACYRK